ncbi:hypothetical protein C3F09_07150 [candidate division GN15 bacterium]|uniref:Rubrerythrin diiron-binding domain-containing protein n=1 Tax=candidate division GN15 bacterium TaxID=2072418 RepID=A0A855X3B1_9BACT|nr:MAG: hypothetical protein C3F09_07150 [candidate division GN15 bacterium]
MADIIDYAMQMELDGKAFYEKHAAATHQPELKKILLQLAEEEQKHYLFFKSLKDGNQRDAESKIAAGPTAALNSKNLFQQLAEQNGGTAFGEQARSVWNQALKIEEKAEKLYRDEAARETDPNRKKLLGRIADEEKTHVYLIDNILSFMVDPQGFLDSANYRNFMSWEGR